MQFEIKDRFNKSFQLAVEIDADESTPYKVRLGLAVKAAIASGTSLRNVGLTGADLRNADLRSADLFNANLCNVALSNADLRGADLRCADLRSADLSNADLHGADLRCVDLRSADLTSANLRCVDLHNARGVVVFGPVGQMRRIGYACLHKDGVMVKLGCFWDSLEMACVSISAKYGPNSNYESLVRAAAHELMEHHK